MHLYIGLDGGATKTRGVLMDEAGLIVAQSIHGSSNYQTAGPAAARHNLAQLLTELLLLGQVAPTQIARVVGGFAGLDGAADCEPVAELISAALAESHLSPPWVALNDGVIAWAGALAGAPGAIMISGTGAIAFAVNQAGHSVHSDGRGHWVGDEGSGFDIGQKGLVAAVRALDQRGPETALVAGLHAYCQQAGFADWMAWVADLTGDQAGAHGRVASFARTVAAVADAGDEVARAILLDAGRSLANTLFSALVRTEQIGQPVSVAGLGSVLTHNATVKAEFDWALHQLSREIRLVSPHLQPAEGAALLARQPTLIPIDTVQARPLT